MIWCPTRTQLDLQQVVFPTETDPDVGLECDGRSNFRHVFMGRRNSVGVGCVCSQRTIGFRVTNTTRVGIEGIMPKEHRNTSCTAFGDGTRQH